MIDNVGLAMSTKDSNGAVFRSQMPKPDNILTHFATVLFHRILLKQEEIEHLLGTIFSGG